MLKYRRAAASIKALNPSGAQMKSWLARNAGTAKGRLIEGLLDLTRVKLGPKHRRSERHVAHGQGAAFLVTLVPSDTGMDEMYEGNLQGLYEETSCMALSPASKNPRVLLSLARTAILGTAVASAAASYLTEFYGDKSH